MTQINTNPVRYQIQCPKCATTLFVSEEARGMLIECPKCKHTCMISDGTLGRDIDQDIFNELVDHEIASRHYDNDEQPREADPPPPFVVFVKKNLAILIFIGSIIIASSVAALVVFYS